MYSNEDIQRFLDTIDDGSQDLDINAMEILLFASMVAKARQDTEMSHWLKLEKDGYSEPQDIDYRKIPGFEVGNSIFELLVLKNYNKLDPFNSRNYLLATLADNVSEKYDIDKQEIIKLINKTEKSIYMKKYLEKRGEKIIKTEKYILSTMSLNQGNEDAFFIGDDRLTLTGNDDWIDVHDTVYKDDMETIIRTSSEKAYKYLNQLANTQEADQNSIGDIEDYTLHCSWVLENVICAKHVAQAKNDTKNLQWLQSELNGYDQPQNLEHRFIHGYEVGNSLLELYCMSDITQFEQNIIMHGRLFHVRQALEDLYHIPQKELWDISLDKSEYVDKERSSSDDLYINAFNLYDGRLKLINAPQNADDITIKFEEIYPMLNRISEKAHDYLNSAI